MQCLLITRPTSLTFRLGLIYWFRSYFFCFLLLAYEGYVTHREGSLLGFPTQFDFAHTWSQGWFRPQMPRTSSLHCPIANAALTQESPIQALTKPDVALLHWLCLSWGTRPDFCLRSSRIRVDLPLYESKPTDKQEEFDWKAEKHLDGNATKI